MPTIQRIDMDANTAHLQVTTTGEELKAKVDKALKDLRKKAHIKGFRQGQAPMSYIKSLYGKAIVVDAFQDMVSEELTTYLREQKEQVLGQPLPLEEQQQYTFKLDNLAPEYVITYEMGFVQPIDLKGMDKSHTFKRPVPSDLDDLVAKDLANMVKNGGAPAEVEDTIQGEDLLKVAVKELTDADGTVKEAGWETEMTFPMNNVADEQLQNELLTKKKGDTIRFNIHHIDKAGRDAHFIRKYLLNLPEGDEREVGDWFEGTITSVSRKQDAELTEEFLKSNFGEEVTTLEAAKEIMGKNIAQYYKYQTSGLLMRDFIQHLVAQNQISLPESFLKRWVRFNNQERELNVEDIERDFPAFAEDLRWSLLRSKLVEEHDVFVTEAEIRNRFAAQVRSYLQFDLGPDFINNFVNRMMQDKKQVQRTEEEIETDKLYQIIEGAVTIEEMPVPSEEIHRILDEARGKQAKQPATDTPDDVEVVEATEV